MNITTVDLRTDAIAEARRVACARAIEASGLGRAWTGADRDGSLVMFARRGRLRRALAGRVLTIWRIAYEDSCGRQAESRLVPLLVDVGCRSLPRRRAWVRDLVRETRSRLRVLVDQMEPRWRADALAIAAAFASARTVRERAIAAQPRDAPLLFQPGLFDRRSERARQLEIDAVRETDRQAKARASAASNAAALSPRGAELLLVLAP
jgi:hypothetical protein